MCLRIRARNCKLRPDPEAQRQPAARWLTPCSFVLRPLFVGSVFIAETDSSQIWSFRTVVARVAAAVRPLPAHVQALVKRFQAMQRRPRAAMGKVRSAFYILSSSVVGRRSWSSGHSCWYPCVVCRRRRYQQPAHHLSRRLPRAFLMIASLVRAGSAEVPPAPPRTAVFLTPGGCDCLW